MKAKKILSFILFSFCFFMPAFSRPKVALVLSGGGAKGFAEIPLLEAIEREGIRPDMVLGTSMGSLIGALYSAGYTPKEIRQLLLSLNYRKILGERPVQPERIPPEVFSDRAKSDTAFSFDIKDRRIGSAPGFVGDQNILCELNNNLSRVLHIDDFDRLPIPFRAVATDVSSGQQIVFKGGNIVTAVRASISLPALFTPAPVGDGRYAMDGGLRNNLPVELARQMGADIVIAIDVASVVDTDPSTLSDMGSVAVQIFNLIISSNAVEQHDKATIVLRPDLKKYSTVDFFHPERIIMAGEECIEDNRDKIHQIALDLEKQGFPIEHLDYDRKSIYAGMADFKIRRVFIQDVSFMEPIPLPQERDYQSYCGKILNESTRLKLTEQLNEDRHRFHLSSFTYFVKPVEGTGLCDLELRANHYELSMSKLFICGVPSVTVTNEEAHNYLSVAALSTVGVYLNFPIESMLRLSTGDLFITDAMFFPRIKVSNTFKLNGEFGAGFKYGSLEPNSNAVMDMRSVNMDKGGSGIMGLRLRYTDLFNLRLGLGYDTDKIMSSNKIFHTGKIFHEIIFTTLQDSFIKLNGFSVEGEAAVGKSNTAGNDTGFVYFWHLAYEHRFMPVKDRSSIGFEFHVCNNRFPYELKSGYFDYGGIDGMCGNPKGTLKRDFAFAGITLRQKIASFGGMPLYGILQGKIGIQDSYDPFFDSGKPNGKFFYEAEKPEAGFGIYLAFKTLFSTIVAGYSMNTQGKWCITLGLK